MASALALQCSTNWAMKTYMLGADQFIEFIFTRNRNETWNEVDLNCGNADEMEMWSSLWYLKFKQLPILARKKISRASTGTHIILTLPIKLLGIDDPSLN